MRLFFILIILVSQSQTPQAELVPDGSTMDSKGML